MKTLDIPVKHKIFGGKKWLYDPISFNVQCAYCLFRQFVPPVRDSDGLVTAIRLEEESHAPNCPQHEASQ